mmetsp:Transcript_51446/g.119570  ORF Transcript_51446/g.119570 Transcript_51446/m.119570 type:complete len:167 (+) Transcript_51446:1167-1667(+)
MPQAWFSSSCLTGQLPQQASSSSCPARICSRIVSSAESPRSAFLVEVPELAGGVRSGFPNVDLGLYSIHSTRSIYSMVSVLTLLAQFYRLTGQLVCTIKFINSKLQLVLGTLPLEGHTISGHDSAACSRSPGFPNAATPASLYSICKHLQRGGQSHSGLCVLTLLV